LEHAEASVVGRVRRRCAVDEIGFLPHSLRATVAPSAMVAQLAPLRRGVLRGPRRRLCSSLRRGVLRGPRRRLCSSNRRMASSRSLFPTLAAAIADFSTDRLFVDRDRHCIGISVLAAVSEREACRIGEAVGRAVHYFRHHSEGSDRSGTSSRSAKSVGARSAAAASAPCSRRLPWRDAARHNEVRARAAAQSGARDYSFRLGRRARAPPATVGSGVLNRC
jgi:hypothetical protein